MAGDRIVAVVSHDAGGAEYLSSQVRRMGERALFVLEGPAKNIFRRKLGAIRPVELAQAIEKATWVLCGTSWQSDLELCAIRLAHGAGKRSVAMLDHWVNFRERFRSGNHYEFPDEIWVADEYAECAAATSIPEVPRKVVGNAYLEDMCAEIGRIKRRTPRPGAITVLYICENIAAHALSQYGNRRHAGYVEEEAMEYFFQNLPAIASSIGCIVVRPHPSEQRGKYRWVMDRMPIPTRISEHVPLTADIAEADVVVGCESMAMIVALMSGKRVVSSIPPQGRESALPYPQIESLTHLVEMSQRARVGAH
jgi:hypothetical protein